MIFLELSEIQSDLFALRFSKDMRIMWISFLPLTIIHKLLCIYFMLLTPSLDQILDFSRTVTCDSLSLRLLLSESIPQN
jgi:hypothetical protein